MTANYKQLLSAFRAKPKSVRNYFVDFSSLVEDYEWGVSVSYVFARIEAVKHTTLYCGIVKLHRCNSELTWEMLNKDHLSRGRFWDLFQVVFGKRVPQPILDKLSSAEKMRDKVAHGKRQPDADIRTGLRDAFEFCEVFNDFVYSVGGFRPFGDLRGFAGPREKLSKETTRWVLRGMGIPAKGPPA